MSDSITSVTNGIFSRPGVLYNALAAEPGIQVPSETFTASSESHSGKDPSRKMQNVAQSSGTLSAGAAAKILASDSPLLVEWNHMWDYETDGEIVGDICPGKNGNLFVCTNRGALSEVRHGGEAWKISFNDPDISAPELAPDGSVCVTDTNTLHVIKDGKRLWELKLGGGPLWKPAAGDDGTIYVASDNGKLYAVKDGEKKWVCASTGFFERRDSFCTSPSVGPDGTVYAGTGSGRVCAIKDGELLWAFETGGELRHPPVVGPAGTVFVATYDGRVFEIKDGKKHWELKSNAKIDNPVNVAPDNTVYFVGADGQFHFAGGWRCYLTGVKGGKKICSIRGNEFAHNSSKAVTMRGHFLSSDPGSFHLSAGEGHTKSERKIDVGYTSGAPVASDDNNLYAPYSTRGISAYAMRNTLDKTLESQGADNGNASPIVEQDGEFVVIDGVRLPMKQGMALIQQMQGQITVEKKEQAASGQN